MTLAQALARATAENPDVQLARLDVRRAQAQVEQTREPYSPKVGAGSGIAKTWGFPASIDGNAPSIVQARINMTLFDRPLHWRVEQSRENARGSEFDVRLKQEDVAYRVASAFLDAEAAERSAKAAAQEVQNLEGVQKIVETQLAEGRALPSEVKRARNTVAIAQDAAEQFAYAEANAEVSLAQLLGFPAGDRVKPALEDRALPAARTQQQAVGDALSQSAEVRRLESGIKARELERKSYKAARMPRVNLVAQYSLLSAINNFDVYYPRFQPHNGQIGASIEIPLLPGKGAKAGLAISDVEIQKLQLELDMTKRRIATDVDQAYRDLARAEKSRSVRKDSIDLALEDIQVLLAQREEGRASMADVERARAEEQRAWRAYYEAQRVVELARLNIQRTTGSLLEALR